MVIREPQSLYDMSVRGADGAKLGKVQEIYSDTETGEPEWAAVRTGLFGNKVAFVPLASANVSDDVVEVPYDKGQVKDAPHFAADHDLSIEEEEALFRHYRIPYGGRTATAQGGAGETRGQKGSETDDAMTRSEEQLHVGTERREAGRVRLRKYVVTEPVTQTVPVSHEEVRIEREPITDANRDQAMSGPDITESEHEVVLHEERPVVQKESVPQERVRLAKETVTEEETIDEQVRKERIEQQ